MSRNVLIVSPERIGPRMAGPAIRCLEFARVLRRHAAVTLAMPNSPHPPPLDGVSFCRYDYAGTQLLAAARRSDVMVLSGLTLANVPALADLGIPIALDIYAPFNLENLEYLAARPPADQINDHNHVLHLLAFQLRRADFYLCANSRQRDYWLGMLSALNRVNPHTYRHDHTLRKLVGIVPFGLPPTPPTHTRQALKGVYPGITAADKVILWGGGIYQWFDPLTLIRAVGQLAADDPAIRLVFMGVKHPNPHVRGFNKTKQAIRLSDQFGLTGRHIFFNDWVPYEERQNVLLEADVGVSLHLDHLETRYAFRTRMLDYIWAGLPILTTGGDELADLVRRRSLGRVVAPQDLAGVHDALAQMLAQPDLKTRLRPHFDAAAAQLTWPCVTKPLLDFCLAPALAPDRLPHTRASYPPPAITVPPAAVTPWAERIGKGWRLL
ncbi:MAG: glycosyltransferase, partial [Anaerolineae bacterium]